MSYCPKHNMEYEIKCTDCMDEAADGSASAPMDGYAPNSNSVVEVSENFYLRATLACIATKNADAETLKAIAKNALDAVGA